MRKRELLSYRRALSAQLAELMGHGARTFREPDASESEELPDPADRATVETDRGQALHLRERDRNLIEKIQAALARIDDGTFGVCESCGGPIGSARLRARPVTTLCIECKTEAELAERRA